MLRCPAASATVTKTSGRVLQRASAPLAPDTRQGAVGRSSSETTSRMNAMNGTWLRGTLAQRLAFLTKGTYGKCFSISWRVPMISDTTSVCVMSLNRP
jgi:hypothetical protein